MMNPKRWEGMMVPSNEMLSYLMIPQQEKKLKKMTEKDEIQEFQMGLAQSKA